MKFVAALLLCCLIPSARCNGQERIAVAPPTYLQTNDLSKYASEASKWETDIAKLVVNNETEGANDAILCLGSSSFRLWDSISEDMAPYTIVRRAYGGAKYCDLAIYAPRLVDGLQFRAAMVFIGNDITGIETDKSPDEIARLARLVVNSVRKQNPSAPVFLIAITPTPSRFKHWPKIEQANQSLSKLSEIESNVFYVATQDKYLDSQGLPIASLFVEDMLHQNQTGYAIWSSILKSALNDHLLKR
jgi:hypothetical protein